jgi:hypothetical protein
VGVLVAAAEACVAAGAAAVGADVGGFCGCAEPDGAEQANIMETSTKIMIIGRDFISFSSKNVALNLKWAMKEWSSLSYNNDLQLQIVRM